MGINLFKRTEKEIIDSNNNSKTNDILDDFGSYISNKTTIEEENNNTFISSFKYNFTEGVNSTTDNNLVNSLNNINIESEENLNNFNSSYNESILENNSNYYKEEINTEIDNKDLFNPYANDIETYNEYNEKEEYEDKENSSQNYVYTHSINEPSKTTNNISTNEDVNIALSNIYNKSIEKGTKKEIPIEVDEEKNISNVPIYENTYKNSLVDPGYKICPKCGQKIREDYKQCFVCGTII